MAARFWVTGGTGNWNSTTNWSATTGGASGASVPSTADTATYDASSGSGTATLDISPDVQTLTMTGFTGTLAFGTNTISLNSTGTIFTGVTTMTVTGTPQIICTNSSATARTINPGLVTEANAISFRITAGTGTVTFTSANSNVLNLDFTDGVNPTGYAGALANINPTIYGNFLASTGMTKTAGTGTMTFGATSGTKTINTAGVTFDNPFTFNGVGGTFQLASALTSGATRTCSLTNGTLDLNGYTLTTGLFSSNQTNVRTLAFGTGKIVLTATSGTIFTTSTSTNLTVTGTNPLIQATAGGAGTRSITIGAAGATNAISVDVTSGTDIISLGTTSGAYKNVNFTGFTGTFSTANSISVFGNWNFGGVTAVSGSSTISFAATSGTKTITSNGVSFPGSTNFNGVGGTFQLQDPCTVPATNTTNLTNGTLDLVSYTLTTGLFASSNSNTRTLAFGTGKMVLTGTNTNVYTTSIATGLTMTGTRTVEITGVGIGGETRTVSGGNVATGGGSAANAANLYIKAGADIFSPGTAARAYGTLDFTGFSGSLITNASPQIYGDLVLSTGMTVTTGTNTFIFAATTAQTITNNNVTINSDITFDGIGGTFACQDALTLGSTKALTMTNGTLKLKSGTTSTVGSFATSGTNQKFLSATTPGTQATLSDASGTNSVNYLTIQDSNATGGAVFQAFTSNFNVDAGNNTGWKFNNAGGAFLMFF